MSITLNAKTVSGSIVDLPVIPQRLRSKDGQMVETDSPIWRLRASVEGGAIITIDWRRFGKSKKRGLLSERAVYYAKLYVADRIQRKMGRTVEQDHKLFLIFERWFTEEATAFSSSFDNRDFNWSDLNEGIARAFLEWGETNTADRGNNFSRLRTFYEWGVARQYTEFDADTLRVLKSITAIGNAKGHHVRFRDPVDGPFSPDEKLLITRAIDDIRMFDPDKAIVMIHLELGLNPNATARLKNRHLIRYDTSNTVLYQLDVPRVKKRTAVQETKRRPISNKLGNLLEKLMKGNAEDPLFHWLSNRYPEAAILRGMQRFASTAKIISPRTGELLKITPRRFRYSLATHMAEEGAYKFHIAEVLDHTDTQNVNVYVETVSSIAEAASKAVDPVVGPLVKRFLGKIANSTEEPVFDGMLNQLIPGSTTHLSIPLINVGGIGVCGRNIRLDGLCKLMPPLSCYLCPSFAALRSGAHQEVLNSIEHFIQEGTGVINDRILRQLDDILVAIKEVLERLTAD